MHSAPAVSFPVGRSRFQRTFLVITVGLGVATCIAWTYCVATADWRQALAASIALAGGLNAWRLMQDSTMGPLKWDGQNWRLDSDALVGRLKVQLDLQFFMLLAFRPETGRTRWLWLDRTGDAGNWLSLRRAVYGDNRSKSARDGSQVDALSDPLVSQPAGKGRA